MIQRETAKSLSIASKNVNKSLGQNANVNEHRTLDYVYSGQKCLFKMRKLEFTLHYRKWGLEIVQVKVFRAPLKAQSTVVKRT